MLPNRKVGSGGLAGVLTVVAIAALKRFEIELSAEEASGLTALLSFVTGYLVPAAPPDKIEVPS